MITETKTIYKCEYCKKLYQIKRFAIQHENICKKNPKNDRLCFNCTYLIKKYVCIEDCDDQCKGNADCNRYSFFYCSETDSFIYPPYVKPAPLIEDENKRMPQECKLYNPYENIEYITCKEARKLFGICEKKPNILN